jgi:integrase
MRLSDATIKSLKPPERGQKLYPDDLTGFGVRVSQGGSKTFVLMVGTNRQRITLGRYPLMSLAEARQRAVRILRERELGIEQKPSPPFGDVYAEFMNSRDDKRASTRRADRLMLRPFLPLSKQQIADIKPEQLRRIIEGIEAPIMRLHVFTNIRNHFRFALKRGYVQANPLDRLDTPRRNPSRERVLGDDELCRVWETAEVYGYPFGTLVKLAVLTGQRRQQLADLRCSFVDFERATIEWPPECMKTKRRHIIPLGKMTADILKPLPVNTDELYFFGSTGKPFASWSNFARAFWKDAQVDGATLHDFRRTLATRWQELGIAIEVTEKMLSHSIVTGGLVGIYQKSLYLTQMREAVERWEKWLRTTLDRSHR